MTKGSLTTRAVVDWIALQIRLVERSNFMTVQEQLREALGLRVGRKVFVKALDETSGRSASIFVFRIQNPNQVKIDHAVAMLRLRFEFGSVEIVGIEVAFDTYCEGATVEELAEITADRYRFITASPSHDWYFYRSAGDGRHYINDDDEICNFRHLVRHFADGWQLTDQNYQDGADVRFHAYVKTHDDGRQLPPQSYRARIEVTLRGAALPCETLEEIAQLDFAAELAKHFKFRRLRDDLFSATRYALSTWTKQQLGRRGSYRRPNPNKFGTYSGVSVFRRSTVADERLNEAVYEDLRKLTRDWRSKRVNADFPGDSDRQSPVSPGKG